MLEGLWYRDKIQLGEEETESLIMKPHLVVVVCHFSVGAELFQGLLPDRLHQAWIFDEVEEAPRQRLRGRVSGRECQSEESLRTGADQSTLTFRL